MSALAPMLTRSGSTGRTAPHESLVDVRLRYHPDQRLFGPEDLARCPEQGQHGGTADEGLARPALPGLTQRRLRTVKRPPRRVGEAIGLHVGEGCRARWRPSGAAPDVPLADPAPEVVTLPGWCDPFPSPAEVGVEEVHHPRRRPRARGFRGSSPAALARPRPPSGRRADDPLAGNRV
jgi:hypothetical protein